MQLRNICIQYRASVSWIVVIKILGSYISLQKAASCLGKYWYFEDQSDACLNDQSFQSQHCFFLPFRIILFPCAFICIIWYVAMVQSKLCYDSSAIFSSMLERGKATISKLPKSVVRAVFGLHNPISTQPLQNELLVSEIADTMFRKSLVFVYRCLDAHASSLSTHYYTAIVCVAGGNHRLTRGQEARLLSIPFPPGPAGRASIHFSGAIMWNLLRPAIRMSPSVCIFKALIKSIGT